MSLKKSMSVPQGVVLAICTIIGSGLLGLPGLAIEAGGGAAAALAWPLTMLISLPLVVIFLSLSLRVQSSGGVARYAAMALGDWAETAVSLIFAITFMLCIPIGTYMGCIYLQKIFGLPESSVIWLAIGVLSVSTIVNFFGLRPASWINIASALSLVLLVVLIVISQPDLLAKGTTAYRHYALSLPDVPISSLWTAAAVLFWAFLGWENLSFGTEEVSGGTKAIKTIFAVGFVLVTAIYAALAVVATGAEASGLNIHGVAGLLGLLDGSPLAIVAYPLIVLVVLANVNAWVFAASRLIYSAGRAHILPSFLGHLAENGMPRRSLAFMLVAYICICTALHLGLFSITDGLMLANQNFIVIYLAVILCYVRLNRSLFARLIALLAVASSLFLVAGFGWTLLVPLALILAGHQLEQRRRLRPAALAS